MRHATLWGSAIGLALGALVSSGASAQSYDRDYQVCYKDEKNRETRLVLDIKFHSRLPTTDRRKYDQRVWDADGKHTYNVSYPHGPSYMAVFDGAVVTSDVRGYDPKVQEGAHLGGTSYFVRGAVHDGNGLGGPQTHPVDWECTSAEDSPAPREWKCTVFTNNSFVASKLVRLDYPDELCNAFEDTRGHYPR